MDIMKKYSAELNMINMHLTDLERGHIYEITKNHTHRINLLSNAYGF